MGTFDFVAPIHHIYAMSSRSSLSIRYVPFCTSYFNNPWTLPSSNISFEGQSHIEMEILLSVAEIAYPTLLDSSVDPDPVSSQTNKEDPVLEPVWATLSYFSHYFLDDTLPSYESIVEAINDPDKSWNDMQHRSYFLPEDRA
jgi:hypothetical protein